MNQSLLSYLFRVSCILLLTCYRHGKDNKLIVWKLSEADEASMSIVLPVDVPPEPRKEPWLLHVLHVNTMNFCSFAHCPLQSPDEELLIAVPNTLSSETVRWKSFLPFYPVCAHPIRLTSSTCHRQSAYIQCLVHPLSKVGW